MKTKTSSIKMKEIMPIYIYLFKEEKENRKKNSNRVSGVYWYTEEAPYA